MGKNETTERRLKRQREQKEKKKRWLLVFRVGGTLPMDKVGAPYGGGKKSEEKRVGG